VVTSLWHLGDHDEPPSLEADLADSSAPRLVHKLCQRCSPSGVRPA